MVLGVGGLDCFLDVCDGGVGLLDEEGDDASMDVGESYSRSWV